jgi:hypothetical protein
VPGAAPDGRLGPTRLQAEALQQWRLLVATSEREALRDPDEFYVQDLVGLDVALRAGGALVGSVVDVISGLGTHDSLRVALVRSAEDVELGQSRWAPGFGGGGGWQGGRGQGAGWGLAGGRGLKSAWRGTARRRRPAPREPRVTCGCRCLQVLLRAVREGHLPGRGPEGQAAGDYAARGPAGRGVRGAAQGRGGQGERQGCGWQQGQQQGRRAAEAGRAVARKHF